MTDVPHEIRGGASPEIAAAIGAIIVHLLDAEATAQATPSSRPRQSQWALAWRPREVPSPLPSHTFDPPGWTEAADPAEG